MLQAPVLYSRRHHFSPALGSNQEQNEAAAPSTVQCLYFYISAAHKETTCRRHYKFGLIGPHSENIREEDYTEIVIVATRRSETKGRQDIC